MGQFGCSGGGDRAGLTPSRQVLVNRVGASGAQTLAHRPNGRLLPLACQPVSGGGDLLKRDSFSCHIKSFRIVSMYNVSIQI